MQFYINDCLQELLDSIYIVYLDNILIYSNFYKEHVEHVHQVLLKLRQFGLTCKLSKCEFSVKKIFFLSYEISSEGVSIDPKHITTIAEWQPPASVYNIQVFLGFANSYCHFIEGYSHIIVLLTNLLKTKNNPKFKWD